MSKITQIKKSLQLSSWTEMIRDCNSSGKTVAQWCSESGINIKTYYYRQSRVRKAMMENYSKNEIVPIDISPSSPIDIPVKPVIRIRKDNLELELSENISVENLSKILRALQC